MREILFYRTKSGACPVEELLDSLTRQQAQKVTWVLRLVEEIDQVPVQYFKKLVNTDGIWEVRAECGGDVFRLLGFLHGTRFVVLDQAFCKKTQKTPQADIRLAEQRKTEYVEALTTVARVLTRNGFRRAACAGARRVLPARVSTRNGFRRAAQGCDALRGATLGTNHTSPETTPTGLRHS